MKCKACGGTGTSNTCVNGTFKPCTFCDGTGEYEPFDADIELDKLYPTEQTNEEWFCGLPTKEKAKVFVDIAQNDFYALRLQYYGEANDDVDAFTIWLKEKHDDL